MSDSNNSKTDMDQNKSKNNRQTPLSRFWACFFSSTIFALLWTGKMKKTRQWILLFTFFITIWFVLDYILYPFSDDSDFTLDNVVDHSFRIEPNYHLETFLSSMIYDYFPNSGNLDDIIFLISFSLIVLYNLVIFIGSLLMIVYFMLKWTTQYNLDNFNYKSKREWKKANIPQHNITEKIKEHSSNIFSNMKDISKKTSAKIPSEKIIETSTKTAEKIADTAKNLKPKIKMSENDKRNQIREWHDMMTLGIITESEFEKKKEEFLKANND